MVSGRRRQGKSYLLEALTTRLGGLYFPAVEATEAESLRMFADALVRHTRLPVEIPFRDWNDAIRYLFQHLGSDATAVVLDEFPFLAQASPALPSIIQRELGPSGAGRGSGVRLLLCGSALSVMGGLLSGRAPLRGRASLELVVGPFGYRDAARFWDITDQGLAVLVHARSSCMQSSGNSRLPAGVRARRRPFGDWVARTVLNPQTPMFREARYLLAEEPGIRDPSLYHSVLSAVVTGNVTSGGVAAFIGRKSDQVAHPLNVLEDAGLLVREPDLLRSGRFRYRVCEPLVTFYHAIMRGRWAELERGRAEAVWRGARQTFLSQVVGPHFEALAREFAVLADPGEVGELPGEVGFGVVNDAANRTRIELVVVVLAPAGPGERRRGSPSGRRSGGR